VSATPLLHPPEQAAPQSAAVEHKEWLPLARHVRSAHRSRARLPPIPARPDISKTTNARRQAGAAGGRAGRGGSDGAGHLLDALHGLQAAVGARNGRRGRRRRRARLWRHVMQHRLRKQPKHLLSHVLLSACPERYSQQQPCARKAAPARAEAAQRQAAALPPAAGAAHRLEGLLSGPTAVLQAHAAYSRQAVQHWPTRAARRPAPISVNVACRTDGEHRGTGLGARAAAAFKGTDQDTTDSSSA